MSSSKVYYTFLAILFTGLIIVGYAHTIFPVMSDDEFFVDKNNVIHNKKCTYKDIPWFTVKPSKYDFVKKDDWVFCKECFSEIEIKKLMMIHDYNLKSEEVRLKSIGADDEYIKSKMEQYGR